MSEANRAFDKALLESYVDKMVSIQLSLQEMQQEFGRHKQDSRTDGFNMEAVHLLAVVRSRSPHDDGVQLMNDMITYGHHIGMDLKVRVEADGGRLRDFEETDSTPMPSHFRADLPLIGERWLLYLQIGLGVAISAGFLWLLR